MEKDIKLGSVGDLDLKQEGGKASAIASIGPVQLGPLSIKVSADIELDEIALIESLIAKYSPSGVLGEILAAAKGALGAPAAP